MNENTPSTTPEPRGNVPARLPAQLDLDGRAHDIAPHTVQERLFTPAPTQLPGQTFLDD